MMMTRTVLSLLVAGLFVFCSNAFALGSSGGGVMGGTGNGFEDPNKTGDGVGKTTGTNNNRNKKDTFKPGTNGTLAWVSWSQAQDAMKNKHKAVLLYVYDPNSNPKEIMIEKRYEVNLFKSNAVREAAAKLVSVMVPKNTPGLPKDVKADVGCWILSYKGAVFIAYHRPPSVGKMANDIRFAVQACAKASAVEKAKKEKEAKVAEKKKK